MPGLFLHGRNTMTGKKQLTAPGASHEIHKEPHKSKPHAELKTFHPK